MSFWKPKKDENKAPKSLPQIPEKEVVLQEEEIFTPTMEKPLQISNVAPFTLPPYKPTIEKKLTILLIENTLEMAKKVSTLNNVRGSIKDGLVCSIYYGGIVWQSAIVEATAIKDIPLFIKAELGEEACLYDALIHVASLVTQKYQRVEEEKTNKIMINSIEIIGVGSCRDTTSSAQKDFAINCFTKVAQKPQVLSKYYCFKEQDFIEAAQIGFRSIGAISKNY